MFALTDITFYPRMRTQTLWHGVDLGFNIITVANLILTLLTALMQFNWISLVLQRHSSIKNQKHAWAT